MSGSCSEWELDVGEKKRKRLLSHCQSCLEEEKNRAITSSRSLAMRSPAVGDSLDGINILGNDVIPKSQAFWKPSVRVRIIESHVHYSRQVIFPLQE